MSTKYREKMQMHLQVFFFCSVFKYCWTGDVRAAEGERRETVRAGTTRWASWMGGWPPARVGKLSIAGMWRTSLVFSFHFHHYQSALMRLVWTAAKARSSSDCPVFCLAVRSSSWSPLGSQSFAIGAPTPVHKPLCHCGRDPSVFQTLFLQVCCTMDPHASARCSASFSGHYVLNSCFSAAGNVQHAVKG